MLALFAYFSKKIIGKRRIFRPQIEADRFAVNQKEKGKKMKKKYCLTKAKSTPGPYIP
jgi:hypothetical protein